MVKGQLCPEILIEYSAIIDESRLQNRYVTGETWINLSYNKRCNLPGCKDNDIFMIDFIYNVL